MLPDTHIHTAFSGDCSTPAAIQIERCISMGMQEVCITDHHDYDTGMKEEIFLLDFPAYLSRLHSLREATKKQNKIFPLPHPSHVFEEDESIMVMGTIKDVGNLK